MAIPLLKTKVITYDSAGNRLTIQNYSGGGTMPIVQYANDPSSYYFVCVGSGNDPYYVKFTDWGDTIAMGSLIATNCCQIASWFDGYSGLTGGLIHIIWGQYSSTNLLQYATVDMSDDSFSSAVIKTGTQWTTASGAIGSTSITRARGGNLLASGLLNDTSLGLSTYAMRSTDGGSTWGDVSNPCEAVSDQLILLPGFAADNQDLICIYWDASANEISRKLYDDSADSWSETSISTGMVISDQSTFSPIFSATVDLTNSKIYMVAWSAYNTSGAVLKCYEITDSSITQLTDVIASSGGSQGGARISIDENDANHLVCFYLGDSGNLDVTNTNLRTFYKESFDAGSTWGDETWVDGSRTLTSTLFGTPSFKIAPLVGGNQSTWSSFNTTVTSFIKSINGVSIHKIKNINGVE